ncbi:MAG: hypothetical protein IK081_08540 [Lachnospiraceae bacterium]|nr:hypothetical protein [Lachnospiraceae bacterium]
MKIDPKHNLKKPKYLIGVALAAAALAAGGFAIHEIKEEVMEQVDELLHTGGIVSAEPAFEAAEAVETTEENA